MKQLAVYDNGMLRGVGANEVVATQRSVVRDAAAVGTTMTPQEFFCDLYLRSGPTAAFTDTLPTGAAMDAFFPDAAIGDSWLMDILNATGNAMTIAAGVGFTLVAGAPTFIRASDAAFCVVKKTAAATWTLEILATSQRPSNVVVKDAAAAGVAMTVAELWANVYLRSGVGAPFSDTLPTGAQMDTAFKATTPIGDGWLMQISNKTAVVMTVVAAAGFTLGSATATIAGNTTVTCQVLRTAANTWTFEILA